VSSPRSRLSAPTTSIETAEVAARLRLSINRLARVMRYQDEGNLSPTLTSILGTINQLGPLTLGRLAELEHLAAPSVTKIVEKLVALGLIERLPNQQDRRVVNVQVSAAGRRHILASRSRRTAWLANRIEELPAEDIRRLADAADVLDRLSRLANEGIQP
jgi:DNA-binding MarR family transcriptional regulator